MQERLVDVLNERNTVLHVVPVTVADDSATETECVQEALKAASHLQLVPKSEADRLHARIHVSRGGPLAPVGDVLRIREEERERAEQRIRVRAYFLWQQSGCPDNRDAELWSKACAAEG